jgi:hypothetical protein
MPVPKQQPEKPESTTLTGEAAPMEFETVRMPNLTNERGRLAREAATLSRDQLVERAEAVGIPTDGTKAEITERVRESRG